MKAGALGALLGLASAADLSGQRLPFAHYSADDGLAGSQVWHIAQDRRGLLWIGTTWGVNRFDGTAFTTLSVADGLPSSTVRLTLEDPDGALWFGTNSGLARYDGVAIASFAERGGALAATVWGGAVDRHGALWFATSAGLVSYAAGEFRTYRSEHGLAADYVYGMLLSRDGALWAASRGQGVSRCVLERDGRLGACRRFTAADGLGADSVRAMLEVDDGAIFFATRGGGLSRFDGSRFVSITVADGLPDDDLYALARRHGELLVGTDSGIGRCALPLGRPCRALTERHGLPDDGVRYFFEDREGVLWIGAEGGLGRLEREDVLSFGEAEGIPDAHVYSLSRDGRGGVWIGTFNGLAHLELGPANEPRLRRFGPADGLPAAWIWALLLDRHGELWAGTEGGLARLRADRRFESWTVADGLAGDYIAALCEDRAGDLWVASTEGVSRLERGATPDAPPRIRAFRVADGLASERSYACALDHLGRVWFSQSVELSYFDGVRFHAVRAGDGLVSRSVRALGVDRSGALWVGGQGQVARLQPDPASASPRFTALDVRGALAEDLVLTIAEDDHGHLLLGTNHGVVTLELDGRGGASVLSRFDRRQGAPASEVSHSSAFATDDRGRNWFGFKGGATLFLRAAEARAGRAPPSVFFERLESGDGDERLAPFSTVLENRQRSLEEGLVELAAGDRSLQVEARANTLRGRGELEYQFQLVGVERDWSEPRRDSGREYVGLRPARYRLLARARFVPDGAWGEPAELRLDLPARFRETRFAALLAALAAGLALLGAAFWRTRRVAAKNRQLAAEVAERTDDLARYARALEEQVHALDRANERIRLADRHRGDFLAKMSHELRTPLTSVLGFAALLRDGLEGTIDSRHLRYLQNIRESGNHLLRLINNLLDQAKIEAGRMDLQLEPANVEVVIESALALIEGFAATRSVRLSTRRAGDLPPVSVDVAKLRQIVINLASNAIKFAPAGSEVEVSTRRLPEGESALAVPAYEIVVADRGPGIEPGERDRIFEPFRQLAARGETVPGTGLGLPIVRQFVALLGGTVGVRERDGGGAEFTVVLPLDPARGAAADPRPEAAPISSDAGDRRRALVIEPDRGRFTTLAAPLDRLGFLAVRAPDAEEGLRMLRELRPAVVAVDIDPSRLESWSALALLDRERGGSVVPWILFAFAPGSERGVAAGFQRCLSAPASTDDLQRALEQALGTSRPRRSGGGIWIAASADVVAPELDRRLEESGWVAVRGPTRARALAGLAAGSIAAVIVDLGDRRSGGIELALAGQTSTAQRIVWIGLVPPNLSSADRRRLLDLVDEPGRPTIGDAVAEVAGQILRPA